MLEARKSKSKKTPKKRKVWESVYLYHDKKFTSKIHQKINRDLELYISFLVFLPFHFILFFPNILSLLMVREPGKQLTVWQEDGDGEPRELGWDSVISISMHCIARACEHSLMRPGLCPLGS